MKILFLAPDPVPAPKGAATRIQLTVEALRDLGHEVRLFTPASAWGDATHDTVALPERNFLEKMMAFRRAAARWLEGQRADVVQFRGIWEGVPALAWARRNAARAVFEVHGFPSVELPYHFSALSLHPGVVEKLIAEERRVVVAADHLVVPSRTNARFVMRLGAQPSDISIVPNAVDTERFVAATGLVLESPPFRMVYQGTISPWQGLGTLIEAMGLRRSTDAELHIVGPVKSTWRAELRALARRHRVHHLVHLSGPAEQRDLPPVLQTAHVCVAPLPADPRNALQGCCPLKLLEYMACGRPILSTRIPPVQEILVDGETARLVRPGSATALADGLSWMIQHPAEREELGRRAREAAVARWGKDAFRARVAEAVNRSFRSV